MIDISKQYSTRDGREVRIYATDGAPSGVIHGAIKSEYSDGWFPYVWGESGKHYKDHVLDLIEVRPRHRRIVWVTVYPNDRYCISSENIQCDIYPPKRIACIKVDLDFEEGDGL
jgi:hypothetical protein